jgi:hypothetical protein
VIKIGFTGTQTGMTAEQHASVRLLLQAYEVLTDGQNEFRHGDCIGADAQAHELAIENNYRVVIHPPLNESKRAFCAGAAEILAPHDYLERNHDIVEASDILIATPATREEIIRSGTWSTIRYADRHAVRTVVVFPDGTVVRWPNRFSTKNVSS